ncbi:MAG: hypothetical protein BGP14_00025 [Sphingobacteriales bacterium 44-15]|nr:MAG: hypothetical protein BGP14_00025 [Sphingobacteriales bacterium 44-15]
MIMRLTVILVLVACLKVSAGGYAQQITLRAKDMPCESVFREITRQSGYQFFFNKKLIRNARNVSVELNAVPVEKAIQICFADQPFDFAIINKTVVIRKKEQHATVMPDATLATSFSADISLSGRVTNTKKEPLEGVSVTVKGTQMGTTTNADGRFQLSVPSANNMELVFSFVGYTAQTVKAGNGTVFDIILEEAVADLSDVVVVGYGTQVQRRVTGSMTVIKSKDIENLGVGSASEALIGKAPGVRISQTSGLPGASPSIKVRGVGSITAGTDPLFVIDGYPVQGINLSNYDLNDISSISVLKDAAAASIYGARAGSGVILITTKRGQAGPPKVSFQTYYGFQKLSKKVDMLTPDEYVEFATDAVNNAWAYLGHDPNDPMEDRPTFYQIPPYFSDKDNWVRTDWIDEIYQTAPMMNSQISVTGGSRSIRYRVSGSFFDQDGIITNSNFKRYTLSTNIDADLTSNLKIAIGIITSKIDEKMIPDEQQWNNGVVATAMSLPGFFATRNEDGSYPSFAGMGYNTSAVRNPMVFINEYNQKARRSRILGNTSLEYNIIKNLQFKSHLGFEIYNRSDNYFQNSYINDVPSIPNYTRGVIDATGSFSANYYFNWLWENTLNYKFRWKKMHDFDFIVGATSQKQNSEDASISARNFPDNMVPTLNAGQVSSASTTMSEWSLLSYFSRINYGLMDKYFLSLSLRADGSSRFGLQNKWGYFPSVSASWIASEENFLRNSSIINYLKIRASYGLSGNNNISNYGSIGSLSYTKYAIGNNNISGLVPSSLSNANLGWEASKQLNVGIDFGFWNDRIRITGDIYQTVSSGLLLNVPVPSILGVTSALQNIGKVRNRGLEISLTTRNLTGNFNWSTDFNISFNRNIVLQLGPSGKSIISTSYIVSNITEVGKPVGNFYGYIFEGVYNSQEEIDKHPHLPTDTPGDPIVKDVNTDGKITPDDRTILGNYQPDFTYGLNNTLRYKGFDLSFFLQGVYGNEVMNLGMYQTGSMTGRTNSKGMARDRWRSPENPGNGKVFKASIDVYGVRRDASTFFMEDGSYIRVRDITLGYNFNSDLLKTIKISSVRVYLSSLNPFTFAKYSGYNPEVSTYDNALTPGIDYFNYPLSKNLILGINITF